MTGKKLIDLADRVAQKFNESDWDYVAELLDAKGAVYGSERLLRSLRFGDSDYKGEVLAAVRKIVDADPGNAQRLIKYIDKEHPGDLDTSLVESVSSKDDGGRRIIFSPLVFKVPANLPDPDLVSVMMPFGTASAPTFKVIKEAAAEAGFTCKRADDIWEDSTIIQDVFGLIYDSYIVVCDFSGKNPNVFYEAGIAHTLGKHVVPITQNIGDIPFDLRPHRHATYLDNSEGRAKLKAELVSRFITLRNARDL